MTDVLCELRDLVAVVTLNRPARRNALSGALLTSLRSTVAGLDSDASVRAIVLTGADPAFCAGLDLTELGQAANFAQHVRHSDRLPRRRYPTRIIESWT